MGVDARLSDYVNSMLLQMRWRCAEISGKHNPAWIYFELLQLIHIFLEFCNSLGPLGMLPAQAGANLLDAVTKKLAPYPALMRLLKSDLLRGSALPLSVAKAPAENNSTILAKECDWSNLEKLLDEFDETLVLEYLEKIGIREILADEDNLKNDFSSY